MIGPRILHITTYWIRNLSTDDIHVGEYCSIHFSASQEECHSNCGHFMNAPIFHSDARAAWHHTGGRWATFAISMTTQPRVQGKKRNNIPAEIWYSKKVRTQCRYSFFVGTERNGPGIQVAETERPPDGKALSPIVSELPHQKLRPSNWSLSPPQNEFYMSLLQSLSQSLVASSQFA